MSATNRIISRSSIKRIIYQKNYEQFWFPKYGPKKGRYFNKMDIYVTINDIKMIIVSRDI